MKIDLYVFIQLSNHFVFDIELDQGVNLKLDFNLTEDPYHAAQKFIHKHDLSQHFLDQIAQFLIQVISKSSNWFKF